MERRNWNGGEVGLTAPIEVLRSLDSRYEDFRPGQREVIEAAQARDVLAVLQTGGGKSEIMYVLSMLERQGLVTVVIEPLVALIRDQVRRATGLGIPAMGLHSGQSRAERQRVFDRLNEGNLAMIYLSPEALQGEFSRRVSRVLFGRVVADEAHCLPYWGRDFRPEYGRVGEWRKRRHEMQMRAGQSGVRALALSATVSSAMEPYIVRSLGLDPRVLRLSQPRPNLKHRVEHFESDRSSRLLNEGPRPRRLHPGKLKALQSLLSDSARRPAIVYCRTRREVEQVTQFLRSKGINAGAYHGGFDSAYRSEVEDRFMQTSDGVVVATNAFGMGVNKNNVRTVVHWSIRPKVEEHLQEIGRAGRDGQDSEVVLFYCRDDVNELDRFQQRNTLRFEQAHWIYQRLVKLAMHGGGIRWRSSDRERFAQVYCQAHQLFANTSPALYGYVVAQALNRINAVVDAFLLYDVVKRQGNCLFPQSFESLQQTLVRGEFIDRAAYERASLEGMVAYAHRMLDSDSTSGGAERLLSELMQSPDAFQSSFQDAA